MAKTAFGAPLVFKNGPGETTWVNDLPVGSNPNYVVYYNDFLVAENYDATNAFNAVLDAGATAAIVADGNNGELKITSAATTDNDGGYIGLNQENFLLASGKKLWFSARVKGSSVADMDLFVGLSEAVATNPENVVAATTHRVGFELVDGAADILLKTSDGTTATSTDTGKDAVDDTYVKLDFVWDGVGQIDGYVNNVHIGSKSTNLPAVSATLTPGFFELSGSATGTRSATIDYMMVVVER